MANSDYLLLCSSVPELFINLGNCSFYILYTSSTVIYLGSPQIGSWGPLHEKARWLRRRQGEACWSCPLGPRSCTYFDVPQNIIDKPLLSATARDIGYLGTLLVELESRRRYYSKVSSWGCLFLKTCAAPTRTKPQGRDHGW